MRGQGQVSAVESHVWRQVAWCLKKSEAASGERLRGAEAAPALVGHGGALVFKWGGSHGEGSCGLTSVFKAHCAVRRCWEGKPGGRELSWETVGVIPSLDR